MTRRRLRTPPALATSMIAACVFLIHVTHATGSEQQTQFSGVLTLTTDYRFRGISNSNRELTPQLELDWNAPDGWTVGTFASGIDFRDCEGTSFEIDLFAIKHIDFHDTAVDISGYYYAYPHHNRRPGSPIYSTLEGLVSLGRELGPVTVNVTAAWSPNYAGETGIAWDIETGANYPIFDWLNASGHLGEQWVHEWNIMRGAGYPYTYWDVGFNASHGPLSFDLRFIGTNLSGPQCALTRGGRSWCGNAVVASVAYAWDWNWPFRPVATPP